MSADGFTHWLMRLQFAGMNGVFGAAGRIQIYETLELFLSNQVLLSKALREIYRVESRDGKRKKDVRALVLYDCMQSLENGRSLSDALSKWVPDEEAQLIRAGERSGELVSALKDVVRIIEAKKAIISAVVAGALYPLFLFGMIALLLNKIATEMVPQFARILPPEKWSGAAVVLRYIADFVVNYGAISLVFIGIFIVWMFWSLPNVAKSPVRKYLDKIPPWSIYRMLHGSTFLLNIAVMLRAGIRVQEILMMMNKTKSKWLRVRIQSALIGISQGQNLGMALHRAGYDFPDQRAVQFLRILAEQDGFDEKLANFGDRWLEQGISNIKGASKVILVAGIATTGVLILLILAGVMSIQTLAQQGM